MNVTIFETEHFEAAYPVIRLFDNGSNQIQICCYPVTFGQLQHKLPKDRYRWVVRKENESKRQFILTLYKECRKHRTDLLYLNTVADNFILYAILAMFLGKTRIIMTVHMVNNMTATQKIWHPKRLIRAIGKKLLCRVVNEFNVISPTLVPALKMRVGRNKKIHVVPGGIYEPENALQLQPISSEIINLAIPGSVDGRRRDYGLVFDLLRQLEQLAVRTRITLLGSFYDAYGEEIRKKAIEWNGRFSQLKFYEEEHVDQPEFDRVLHESHYVFSPSVLKTVIADDVAEEYGKTIVSGNMSDAIRHAKPLIIPAELAVDPMLENACIRYRDVLELATYLQQVQQQPALYEELRQKSEAAVLPYTLSAVRKHHSSLF
ncbi:hypothetical protein LZZ85_10800 [Terrimonas sp. NA20]|uniref:Glycosyltransferase n=1 Tax=Terrimonas ginsenosidimutans TaxID=2908004 RepID=A0ABS9KR59_9BACT|nr:hypothetical protein [Terrimonas ginsenosidimutans]MCG2614774.1 hypothetical protein [Terrimonas ginsenosidimutans]